MIPWEEELVQQVQQGRPGAFARLVREFEPSLQQAVYQFLGDADAAADVTQEAFLATFQNIHLYNPDHRYFSWLYRIAINGALNQVRHRKFTEPLGERDIRYPGPAPDDLLMAKELRNQVKQGLATLRFKYRILVILRHFLDFSYPEIAEITGLPLSTVRSRLHTAKVLLKEELGSVVRLDSPDKDPPAPRPAR